MKLRTRIANLEEQIASRGEDHRARGGERLRDRAPAGDGARGRARGGQALGPAGEPQGHGVRDAAPGGRAGPEAAARPRDPVAGDRSRDPAPEPRTSGSWRRRRFPARPILPRKVRNYELALFFGLVLGVGLAIFFERMDNTVKTPDDVTQQLGPALPGHDPDRGAGPGGGQRLRRGRAARGPARAAVGRGRGLPGHPHQPHLLGPGPRGRIVLFGSANPGEGKTTTVANLAASLAQNGARVLAIDADLRRPTLHRHFGLSHTPGLSDAVVGRSKLLEVVRPTTVSGLSVIPCGYIPPEPGGAPGLGQPARASARAPQEVRLGAGRRAAHPGHGRHPGACALSWTASCSWSGRRAAAVPPCAAPSTSSSGWGASSRASCSTRSTCSATPTTTASTTASTTGSTTAKAPPSPLPPAGPPSWICSPAWARLEPAPPPPPVAFAMRGERMRTERGHGRGTSGAGGTAGCFAPRGSGGAARPRSSRPRTRRSTRCSPG